MFLANHFEFRTYAFSSQQSFLIEICEKFIAKNSITENKCKASVERA